MFRPFPDNDITQEERLYVAEIQEKLRALEIAFGGRSNVPVDGALSTATTQAIKDFQKRNGLPITGIMDHTTFTKLTDAYNLLLDKSVLSGGIRGFFGEVFREPEQSDGIFFLNIMLRRIASLFTNIPSPDASPVYSGITRKAVEQLQTVFLLPPTGVVNRRTWNRITALYNDLMQTRVGKT